ncbi:MAG TPA: TIGR00289 family protein [Candidatus Bathyarchaeota archaeon]|nr:TIGR00289 family protein [Candidatus Bathyarchaeota archaeon]
MRLAALFTGGKDSTYAAHLAEDLGELRYLVTMIPQREDSWMFHTVNIGLASLIAEAYGVEHVAASTSGVREEELQDLKRVLEDLDIDAVVSGVIASNYQRRRIDKLCRQLGLRHITPLWGREPAELLGEMLEAGLRIMVTGVAALGLDERWLGRILDEEALGELVELNRRYGINVCGDGGEMETLVLDAPWFRYRVEIIEAERLWDGVRGVYHIRRAELIPKG